MGYLQALEELEIREKENKKILEITAFNLATYCHNIIIHHLRDTGEIEKAEKLSFYVEEATNAVRRM